MLRMVVESVFGGLARLAVGIRRQLARQSRSCPSCAQPLQKDAIQCPRCAAWLAWDERDEEPNRVR